jgi:membrane protease subunit HflK
MSDAKVHPFKKKGNGNIKGSQMVVLLILAVILIVLVSGFYKVDQTEEAVVLRFGRFYKIASPGLSFKIPFGIDRVEKVPVQRTYTVQFGFRTEPGEETRYSREDYIKESLMLTGDLNIVNVSWILQYQIVDPKAWLFNFREEDRRKEKTIRDVAQSDVNERVGDRAIFEVMSDSRTEIEVLAQEKIERILNGYEMGVNITSVQLQDVLPPEGTVQEAFQDVNKSIQDKDRFINEGLEAYNTEYPLAEGEAKRLIREAEGYAASRVNIARGDVARFISVYEEYSQSNASRSIMRDRLYYETLEQVLGEDSQVELVDRNLQGFLPIKNLGETAGGGATE